MAVTAPIPWLLRRANILGWLALLRKVTILQATVKAREEGGWLALRHSPWLV